MTRERLSLSRSDGSGDRIRKELIVRTIIPWYFEEGANRKLILRASDVTDYQSAGYLADTSNQHFKKYVVGRISIVGVCDRPTGYDKFYFNPGKSDGIIESVRGAPDIFM